MNDLSTPSSKDTPLVSYFLSALHQVSDLVRMSLVFGLTDHNQDNFYHTYRSPVEVVKK